jgi:radical SAM protein with 4Fe4S-binding SPASM domain
VEQDLVPRAGIPLLFGHPPAFRPLGSLLGTGDGCWGGRCGILSVLGVLWDGHYALCGMGNSVPGLVFGHARNLSTASVWEETPVLRELRAGLPDRLEGVCRDCLLKRLCQGHCMAMNLRAGKNVWEPFWYCEAARNAGRFPAARSAQPTRCEQIRCSGIGPGDNHFHFGSSRKGPKTQRGAGT